MPPLLKVFVYGTLKRGWWNHEPYMKGYVAVEPCTIVGRVHLRHTRTPILDIPRANVLAIGTADAAADLETQTRIAASLVDGAPLVRAGGEWFDVKGELYTFSDAPTRVPHLDGLEEYVPGAPSLYDRVLAPVGRDNGRVAWVYVIPARHTAADYQVAKNPADWDPRAEGHPRAIP